MAPLHSLHGPSGLEFSSLEWLLLHHRVKISDRLRTILRLDLKPGQRILDVGCGPGLWAELLGKAVGPHGLVVGVDQDEQLLDFAQSYCLSLPWVSFCSADVATLPFPDNHFDLSFCSNCYGYLEDPRTVLAEQIRVTKEHGRIVGRHWEELLSIYHPVPRDLLLRVLGAASTAEQKGILQGQFDNSFGKKLPALFWRSGLRKLETTTFAFQRVAPLDQDSREFIRYNAMWLIEVGNRFLSKKDIETWHRMFSRSSDSILHSNDLYYCSLDVETIADLNSTK